MARFTAEDKIATVERYLEGKESLQTIGASIGVTESIVRNWVNQYRHHGVQAFIKPYTSYSMQFKLDVLNYMNEHRASSYEAAAIFNIPSPRLIRKWRNLFEEQGIDALESKKKGRPPMKKDTNKTTKKSVPVEISLEALQAENERLRIENAYLKKLNALVQEKEALQRKTKRK